MNKQLHADLVVARAALVGHFGKNAYYRNTTECFCSLGAVAYAVNGFDFSAPRVGKFVNYKWSDARIPAMAKALCDSVPSTFAIDYDSRRKSARTDEELVAAFNDHDATTEADVLAMYDRAIEKAAAA